MQTVDGLSASVGLVLRLVELGPLVDARMRENTVFDQSEPHLVKLAPCLLHVKDRAVTDWRAELHLFVEELDVRKVREFCQREDLGLNIVQNLVAKGVRCFRICHVDVRAFIERWRLLRYFVLPLLGILLHLFEASGTPSHYRNAGFLPRKCRVEVHHRLRLHH